MERKLERISLTHRNVQEASISGSLHENESLAVHSQSNINAPISEEPKLFVLPLGSHSVPR